MAGSTMTMVARIVRAVFLCVFLIAAAVFSGCASTRSEDSDLPWNAPQPWEGSPMIPGFNGMGR